MDEELDSVSILKKIHEIEKIKLTIFNEDQLMLFDYISKPLVRINESDIKSKNYIETNSSLRMTNIIDKYKEGEKKINQKSLKNIKKNLENDKMNERLLHLIEHPKNLV